MPSSSSRDGGEERRSLEAEVALIQETLRQRGELPRAELARASGARYWGPGRFGGALKEAVRRRLVLVPRRGRYGPR
jgi:hypothetical protein